jgi:hypothetical protein
MCDTRERQPVALSRADGTVQADYSRKINQLDASDCAEAGRFKLVTGLLQVSGGAAPQQEPKANATRLCAFLDGRVLLLALPMPGLLHPLGPLHPRRRRVALFASDRQ